MLWYTNTYNLVTIWGAKNGKGAFCRAALTRRCVATHAKNNRMPQFLVMLGRCFVLLFGAALPARAAEYDATLNQLSQLQALAAEFCAQSDSADDPVLLTLTYTRSGAYSSTVWAMTAGLQNSEFDAFVAQRDPTLSELKYVGSLTLPNGQAVDFNHLLASINMTYRGLPTAGGWGGDCMELAQAYSGQASDADGYAELMRATFNSDDDGTNSVFGDQDLRADLDSVIVGTQISADSDLAATLRNYYANLTDYDRARQFIMLSFGSVNTGDASFKEVVYNALLQDSGAQLMLYLNGMWQLDDWQLDPDWAPALRGATDLLAEYLSGCVNGERITGNGSSLVAMGGQALAEALTVLGEYDAADAVLAAESSAAATPAPDSDTASAVIGTATDALREHFDVKIFQVILLILGAIAVFVLIFSIALLVNHSNPPPKKRRRK